MSFVGETDSIQVCKDSLKIACKTEHQAQLLLAMTSVMGKDVIVRTECGLQLTASQDQNPGSRE